MQLLDRARRRAQRIGAVEGPAADGASDGREAPDVVGPHEDADPDLDTSLYTCSCGYVFEAPVSTRIDCPHCGNQQAW
jgi:hypothetical protein